MNLQKNTQTRFKISGVGHINLFDGSSTSALKQWVFVLSLGIVLTAGAVWWSADNFNYWSNLEEKVDQENVSVSTYNKKAVRSIIEDYENRAERLEAILNGIVPMVSEEVVSGENEEMEEGAVEEGDSIEEDGTEEVSTTTATSTPIE